LSVDSDSLFVEPFGEHFRVTGYFTGGTVGSQVRLRIWLGNSAGQKRLDQYGREILLAGRAYTVNRAGYIHFAIPQVRRPSAYNRLVITVTDETTGVETQPILLPHPPGRHPGHHGSEPGIAVRDALIERFIEEFGRLAQEYREAREEIVVVEIEETQESSGYEDVEVVEELEVDVVTLEARPSPRTRRGRGSSAQGRGSSTEEQSEPPSEE